MHGWQFSTCMAVVEKDSPDQSAGPIQAEGSSEMQIFCDAESVHFERW